MFFSYARNGDKKCKLCTDLSEDEVKGKKKDGYFLYVLEDQRKLIIANAPIKGKALNEELKKEMDLLYNNTAGACVDVPDTTVADVEGKEMKNNGKMSITDCFQKCKDKPNCKAFQVDDTMQEGKKQKGKLCKVFEDTNRFAK